MFYADSAKSCEKVSCNSHRSARDPGIFCSAISGMLLTGPFRRSALKSLSGCWFDGSGDGSCTMESTEGDEGREGGKGWESVKKDQKVKRI